jgi:hypothetical protein
MDFLDAFGTEPHFVLARVEQLVRWRTNDVQSNATDRSPASRTEPRRRRLGVLCFAVEGHRCYLVRAERWVAVAFALQTTW